MAIWLDKYIQNKKSQKAAKSSFLIIDSLLQESSKVAEHFDIFFLHHSLKAQLLASACSVWHRNDLWLIFCDVLVALPCSGPLEETGGLDSSQPTTTTRYTGF